MVPVSQNQHVRQGVERAMGIEPTAQAWEAWVLPLYDARSELEAAFYALWRSGSILGELAVLPGVEK